MMNVTSFNQSIKTNLYSAVRRRRIRGAYWRTLGRLFMFTIEQFSFKIHLDELNSSADRRPISMDVKAVKSN